MDSIKALTEGPRPNALAISVESYELLFALLQRAEREAKRRQRMARKRKMGWA